ncbi:phosphodiesterase [Bradyrhizobium sp. LHD-71]|uniref:phosphodiesterase n=1 Tax=Bradyrhizobium sp. LHD-71 TaxID=3072141 RepID=UPI00280CAF8A|nr:phosphodiesterase [Bradyrhizobium sp. LHD-71]MDQ8732489.1 phosphodiesterase [Bradyrhizobium sp. LHD-71]
MLIAQITDSHVEAPGVIAHDRYDARALLARALQQITTMVPRPHFILHTGDATHHGDVSVNRDVRAMLESTGLPYCIIPGNHDEIEPMRAAYADTPWMPKTSFLHYVIEDFRTRIVCLDTTIPGEVPGTLCEQRLAWLEGQLAAGGSRPTMIAMHHPAFRIGRPFSDARPFRNADKFAALVARYPNVSLIVAGHVHCTLQARIGNAVAIAAPSTAYQFLMDRREDASISLIDEPPGMYLHDWSEPHGFTSQVALVGDFNIAKPTYAAKRA